MRSGKHQKDQKNEELFQKIKQNNSINPYGTVEWLHGTQLSIDSVYPYAKIALPFIPKL